MRTVPLSRAKDELSALMEDAASTHGIVHITKHSRPGAVLMAADDLESLRETLFWLQQDQVRDDLDAGEDEYASGQTISAGQLRTRHGLPAS